MAEQSSAEPSDLARCEQAELGLPQTTDLDEEIAVDKSRGMSGAQVANPSIKCEHSTAAKLGRQTQCASGDGDLSVDKEDVVTVKYFPLKVASTLDTTKKKVEQDLDGSGINSQVSQEKSERCMGLALA